MSADSVTQSCLKTIANTGAATVTVAPHWTNTNDNREQQMIDRTILDGRRAIVFPD